MVDRKQGHAPTDEEYWDDRLDELQEAELPGEDPAIYAGEERYELIEEAVEEASAEALGLGKIVYGERAISSSIPEDFDRDSRVVSAERHAGVTMDRPGNNPSHYEQNGERPPHKEPHTEDPRYEEWATGFEDEEAMVAFSGLFENEGESAVKGHTYSEGDLAFGVGYDAGLQD